MPVFETGSFNHSDTCPAPFLAGAKLGPEPSPDQGSEPVDKLSSSMHSRVTISLAVMLSLAVQSAPAQVAVPLPYRDTHLSTAARVRDLLARMTLEEKFWQLFMIPGDLDDARNDYSHGIFGLQIRVNGDTSASVARHQAEKINSVQRYFVSRTHLGIPIIPFEEALHGLAAARATVFPQAIGLAATWDTTLMLRVAGAIAAETRSRGIRQVLSPVINVATDVRWGRVEESYGEDPWLTSQMAKAFIGPFETAGVVTTPKHFIANVGDGGRDSYPIDVDERLLDELYFPPFKAAVTESHARSVMASYNSVGGLPASQNHWLLTEKLKREWGFRGFVISDAAATAGATVLHMTEASTASAAKDALEAGLDVIFQSSYPQYRPYFAAFRRGIIADSVIDKAVTRVLRAKVELGLFERPFVDPDSAAYWSGNRAHRDLTLEAAREAIVLLKNDGNTLPLSSGVRSIAVIGTDAVEARFGGYSGSPAETVSILDGIRSRAGSTIAVRYAAGPGRINREYLPIPPRSLTDTAGNVGLRGEYFANPTLAGAATLVRTDAQVDFGWTLNSPGRGIPFDWYSVRWTGRVVAPVGGVERIGIEGNDGYRLFIDDTLLIDNWRKQSYGSRLRAVHFPAGTAHVIRLEFFERTGNARIRLVWDAGVANDWRSRVSEGEELARTSDVAIVVAGIEEGEFRDRASLSLPGHQEELIRAVAGTGKPTIVVLVGGSAITMSRWLDSVPAVVDAWYPGEQGGRAVADVLFGDYDPGGRLPITFPIAEGQLPLSYNHHPTGRGDDYLDLTGQPLFPFGFGLSYTTFDYSGLQIEHDTIPSTGTTVIRCRVRNAGTVAGDEVVQLYIRDLIATTARPVMQLEGFRRIHLAPGDEREVTFPIGPQQLQMLARNDKWIVEPGGFRIMIGSSSKDIRLRGELTVR
jgi:beta-glucosidase